MLINPALVRIIYSTVLFRTSLKVNKGLKKSWEKNESKQLTAHTLYPHVLWHRSECKVLWKLVVCVSAFFHISAKLLFLGTIPHLTGSLPA